MSKRKERCAYCGIEGIPEREHVVPRCLYPKSRDKSRVQRITVAACSLCNRAWSDDEAHFRTAVLLASDANGPAKELWKAKANPSFYEVDGLRRVNDLNAQLVSVTIEGQERKMIYPGRDERVIRVVKKIVRGLSHHHEIESPVEESRIWADVLKVPIPEDIIASGTFNHCEPDIFRYWFENRQSGDIRSVWRLTFFNRVDFIAVVQTSPLLF